MSRYRGTGFGRLFENAETVQVTPGPAFLERIIVSSGTVSVYDANGSDDNLVLKNIDASTECGLRVLTGLRIKTSGTVNITIIYVQNG